MRLLALFQILFFFLLPATLEHQHPNTCGHKYLETTGKVRKPYRILQTTNNIADATITSEKTRISAGQPPKFSNLRLTFDYQLFDMSLLNSSQLDFFQNTLLSSVQNFYQSTIRLYPKSDTIYPPSTVCNNASLPVSQSTITNGYNNTDMVVYVIGENNKDEDYIAWAMTCNLDPQLYDRPIIGLINCNFHWLDWALNGFDACFKTLAHEMFHFIVFTSDKYPYYVSEDGVTLGLNQVVAVDISTGNYKMILNNVKSFGAQFFNCSSLDGIWLENNEGTTVLGSHWEDTYFRSEMMSPIDRPNKRMSNFSFNLLNSVGWYMVNFDNIQDYFFGYNEGCNFEALGCLATPLFPEYCSTQGTTVCQEDFSGVGVCSNNQFTNNGCFTNDADSTSMCSSNVDALFNQDVSIKGGSISPNSFCFDSSLIANTGSSYPASCYIANCIKGASKTYTSIVVTIGNSNYTCTSEGQQLTVSGYQGSLICPNIPRFCEYQSVNCITGCNSGMGVCSTGGICHFYKGEGICSKNCSSCVNSSSCLVCQAGFYKLSPAPGQSYCSSIPCLSKQYFDDSSQKCINCDSSCLTCEGPGSTNCSTCSSDSYLDNQKSCIKCASLDQNCLNCAAAQTDGSFTCTNCSTSYFVNSSSFCEACFSACLTCTDNTDNSCLSCGAGFYLKTKQCLACDTSCLTCTGPNTNNCASCFPTQYLNSSSACENNDCSSLISCSLCEVSTSSSVLVCDLCLDGFYLQGGACYACNKTCKTCSAGSENDCQSCKLGNYLNGSTCLSCDLSCKNCTGPTNSSTDCLQCNVNYAFNAQNVCEALVCDKTCKDCIGKTANDCYDCYDGRFFNITTTSCDLCSVNCSTCSGPLSSDCLSCPTNLTLVEGLCMNTSIISEDDITSTKSLEGLNNLTASLNNFTNVSSTLKNLSQAIIAQIVNLTASNSSNLSSSDLSSLANVLETLLNVNSSDNNSWDSSMTTNIISILKNISSSFYNVGISSGSIDDVLINSLLSSLSELKDLNSISNDTVSKKQNEKNVYEATTTIIDSSIYNLISNSSISSISLINPLCNYQISTLQNSTQTQSISVSPVSLNTDSPSINISLNLLKLSSSGMNFIRMIEWADDPHNFSDTSNTSNLSSVVTISFYSGNKSGFSGLSLNNLTNNQSFKLPKVKGQSIASNYSYSCVYWNEVTSKWESSGLSTTQPQSSDGSLVCSSNHFSDFAFTVVWNSTIQYNSTGGNNDTNGTNGTNFGNFLKGNYWEFLLFSLILIQF